MFSIFKQMLIKLPTVLTKQKIFGNQFTALYHALMKPNIINVTSMNKILQPQILTPTTTTLIPTCGFKVKGRLKRRCKDCYFVVREKRLYVICKTHPRHKQMAMVPKEKNTWILSHATMGKVRPW